MFYTDESVIVKINVDNSTSTRNIQSIACTLRYKITIKKSLSESLQEYVFDLKLLQFEGIERNKKRDSIEFTFDLATIFSDFSDAKSNAQLRSQVISKMGD